MSKIDLQQFDLRISQAKISNSYGALIRELKNTASLEGLDANTRTALEEKIRLVEKLIEDAAQAMGKVENTAAKTNDSSSRPQIFKSDDEQEKIKRKALKFKKAREKLFSIINDNLQQKKIVAVNVDGEIVEMNAASGIPADVVGFAGSDPAALQKVAQGMDEFCEAIPTELGYEVKKVATYDASGNENRFFAVMLPENYNAEHRDPFAISDSEIESSLRHEATTAPSPKPVAKIESGNENNSGEKSLDAFKNRIGRAFSVFNGSPEAMAAFHQEQIILMWQNFVKENKVGRKLLEATKLEPRIKDINVVVE